MPVTVEPGTTTSIGPITGGVANGAEPGQRAEGLLRDHALPGGRHDTAAINGAIGELARTDRAGADAVRREVEGRLQPTEAAEIASLPIPTIAGVGSIPETRTGADPYWFSYRDFGADPNFGQWLTQNYLSDNRGDAYAEQMIGSTSDWHLRRFVEPTLERFAPGNPEITALHEKVEARIAELDALATREVDVPILALMGGSAGAGFLLAAAPVAGPALGLGSADSLGVALVLEGAGSAVGGAGLRTATGGENTLDTAVTDFTFGAGGGLVFRGGSALLGRVFGSADNVAPAVAPDVTPPAAAPEVAPPAAAAPELPAASTTPPAGVRDVPDTLAPGRTAAPAEANPGLEPIAPNRSLQLGVRPQIRLDASEFSADEIAWINHKYQVAEIRSVGGLETSRVGENVPYSYDLSRRFARDTLAPGQPLRSVRINDVAPGMNVDEYVSRHLGGRQVPANQNWAPGAPNQRMGSIEYNAVRDLPKGTQIDAFDIIWNNR